MLCFTCLIFCQGRFSSLDDLDFSKQCNISTTETGTEFSNRKAKSNVQQNCSCIFLRVCALGLCGSNNNALETNTATEDTTFCVQILFLFFVTQRLNICCEHFHQKHVSRMRPQVATIPKKRIFFLKIQFKLSLRTLYSSDPKNFLNKFVILQRSLRKFANSTHAYKFRAFYSVLKRVRAHSISSNFVVRYRCINSNLEYIQYIRDSPEILISFFC